MSDHKCGFRISVFSKNILFTFAALTALIFSNKSTKATLTFSELSWRLYLSGGKSCSNNGWLSLLSKIIGKHYREREKEKSISKSEHTNKTSLSRRHLRWWWVLFSPENTTFMNVPHQRHAFGAGWNGSARHSTEAMRTFIMLVNYANPKTNTMESRHFI